jgi:hypothetical protein
MDSIDPPSLDLRPGEWVEVRSEAEILATLDANSTYEALPFMPEMLQLCGRRFRVRARAGRTSAERVGTRQMDHAVHLEDLRCDGEAHDGCRRGCLLFFKEIWLKRAGDPPHPTPPAELVTLKTRNGGGSYFCQASELGRATRHLPARDLRQYLEAVRGENLSFGDLLRALAVFVYDGVMRILRRPEWNFVGGPCQKTPTVSLNLQPGERVRVKSKEEIVATLDRNGWNRKMEFSREMLPFCGKVFTVLRRVDRIIRDHTGEMTTIKDTVILDGLTYKDFVRRAPPRAEWMFWRECWLERVG